MTTRVEWKVINEIRANVWADQRISGSRKLVLLALAEHIDPEGTCFPSLGRLALMVCLSSRQVRRHLTALKNLGVINVEIGGGRGGTSQYRICAPEKDRKDIPGFGGHLAVGVTDIRQKEDTRSTNPVAGDTQNLSPVSPRTSEEQIEHGATLGIGTSIIRKSLLESAPVPDWMRTKIVKRRKIQNESGVSIDQSRQIKDAATGEFRSRQSRYAGPVP